MKHRRIWFVMLGIIAIGVLVTTCNSFILKRETARVTAADEYAMDEAAAPADFEEGSNRDAEGAPAKGADESRLTPGTTMAEGPLMGQEALADQGAQDKAAMKEDAAGAPAETGGQEVLSPLETTAAAAFAESASPGPGDAAGPGEVVGPGAAEKNSSLLIEEGSKTSYRTRLDELDLQIQKMRSSETEATTYSMKTAAENELKLWDSELNTIYNDLLTRLNEEKTKELVTAEREWMKERDAKAVEAAKKSAGGTLEGLEYTASLAESTRQRAYELAELYELLVQ